MRNLNEQQYADELLIKYLQIKQLDNFGWAGMNRLMAIQCAKIDVQNTIDALARTGICDTQYYKRYEKVLTILNDMK